MCEGCLSEVYLLEQMPSLSFLVLGGGPINRTEERGLFKYFLAVLNEYSEMASPTKCGLIYLREIRIIQVVDVLLKVPRLIFYYCQAFSLDF